MRVTLSFLRMQQLLQPGETEILWFRCSRVFDVDVDKILFIKKKLCVILKFFYYVGNNFIQIKNEMPPSASPGKICIILELQMGAAKLNPRTSNGP